MTSRWPTKNLGDLCQVVGGGTPSKAKTDYYSGEVPWATVRDMRSEIIIETECSITRAAVKNSSTKIVPSGNVVIATRVGLGKVCLLGQDTAINQDLRGIIPTDTKILSVGFLFWWLKATADVIVAQGTGATVQGVKLPFIKSLRVPLPPLPEQERIVRILDEGFKGIATAKENANKCLQNAHALFESHLQTVFSQHGKAWVIRKFADCVFLQEGPGIRKYEYAAVGYPMINVRCVKDGHIDMSDARQANTVLANGRWKHFQVDANDILFTISGTIGRSAVVKESDLPILMNTSVVRFRPLRDDLDLRFLAYFVRTQGFIEELSSHATGTAQKNVGPSHLNLMNIAYPPLTEQRRIVELLDRIRPQTQRLESIYQRKATALEVLKKSLLNEAFSGSL